MKNLGLWKKSKLDLNPNGKSKLDLKNLGLLKLKSELKKLGLKPKPGWKPENCDGIEKSSNPPKSYPSLKSKHCCLDMI